MEDYFCPNCKGTNFKVKKKGLSFGMYCADCDTYIGWINHKEAAQIEEDNKIKEFLGE